MPMRIPFALCIQVVLSTWFWNAVSHSIYAQQRQETAPTISRANLDEQLENNGKITFQGVEVRKYDFALDGKNVESLLFVPTGSDSPDRDLTVKPAGIMLIPGHRRTARDLIMIGNNFARAGYVCMSVTQPGYGKSEGKPDFVGPNTVHTMRVAYERFQRDGLVDPNRMAIYGYSRGAMAASLLAVSDLNGLRAAVLGGGVYDLQKAYDETTLEGIRENIRSEMGMTREAFALRSSITSMEKLNCPVLILHGEQDVNAPTSQAILLRDRLKELGKAHAFKLFPNADHGLSSRDVTAASLEFFKVHL